MMQQVASNPRVAQALQQMQPGPTAVVQPYPQIQGPANSSQEQPQREAFMPIFGAQGSPMMSVGGIPVWFDDGPAAQTRR